MAVPTITPLPEAPSRSEGPDEFNAKADPFIASLPPFVLQANLLASAINDAILDITNKAESAASSANAAATSAGQALNSQSAAAVSAQTAQIAAAASGASAGIGQLGNAGDSLRVNDTRTGLVFGPSDGKVGDVLVSARNPGPLFLPANGGIRASSSAPTLLAVLGYLSGQIGQQYSTVSAGATTTVVDVASASNPIAGGTPLIMQLCVSGVVNFSSDGGATWVARTPINLIGALSSLSYDEFNRLWMVTFSNAGNIIISSDDGLTWTGTDANPGASGGNSRITADTNGVWICSLAVASTVVHRSADKGATWTAITTGSSLLHTAISTDNKGVWCLVGGSVVRRSVDGGLTWPQQFALTTTVQAISNDRNGVWLVSGLTSNTNTWKSVDNGQSWVMLSTPVTSTVTDIAYSQGFFFLVRNVSPQLIMISSAADATAYTVIASAVMASLSKVTALGGYVVAANTANTSVLRSPPMFSYDPTSQFQLPDFPVSRGLTSWIKAGLVMASSGKNFVSGSVVGVGVAGIDTDGFGIIIAVGSTSIRRSVDYGVTWTTIANPTGVALSCIATNRKGLWIIGGTGVVLRSTDNGATFNTIASGNHGFSTSIGQIVIGKNDVMIGCTVSAGTYPRKSADGGLTWSVAGLSTIVSRVATDRLGRWLIAYDNNVNISTDNAVSFGVAVNTGLQGGRGC